MGGKPPCTQVHLPIFFPQTENNNNNVPASTEIATAEAL